MHFTALLNWKKKKKAPELNTLHTGFSCRSFVNAILIQFANLKWKKKMGLNAQSDE